MARSFRWIALVLGALVLAMAVPAGAATPATGSLSAKKKSVAFNGGPFTTSFPTIGCLGETDPTCDAFDLQIFMGDGAKFSVAIDAPSPNDFDLYVFGPDGTELAKSGSMSSKESVVITHKAKFRGKAYFVRVLPYIVVPGAMYKGVAKITKFVK